MIQSDDQRKRATLWPEALDATIAAPGNHNILIENDQVRVLDTSVGPGNTVPLHTHCWPGVMYVLSFSDFVRYDEQGNVLLDSRQLAAKPQPGEAMWSPPLPPHSLKNVGSSDLRVITVELKGDAWQRPD
jgi:quercetin dioxygenase-like cupin family protein